MLYYGEIATGPPPPQTCPLAPPQVWTAPPLTQVQGDEIIRLLQAIRDRLDRLVTR